MKNVKHRKLRLAVAHLLRIPAIALTNAKQRVKRWHDLTIGGRPAAMRRTVGGFPIWALGVRPYSERRAA